LLAFKKEGAATASPKQHAIEEKQDLFISPPRNLEPSFGHYQPFDRFAEELHLVN
jgi:hypothetical protein